MTGDGEGDDEIIHVDLGRISPEAAHLVFTVTSFQGQTFDEVDNAFSRLVDAVTGMELCRYTLRDQGPHTGVIMVCLSRTGSGWTRLCCTNPVWDSSHESSVVAGIHEQTYTPDLQDQELASLQ